MLLYIVVIIMLLYNTPIIYNMLVNTLHAYIYIWLYKLALSTILVAWGKQISFIRHRLPKRAIHKSHTCAGWAKVLGVHMKYWSTSPNRWLLPVQINSKDFGPGNGVTGWVRVTCYGHTHPFSGHWLVWVQERRPLFWKGVGEGGGDPCHDCPNTGWCGAMGWLLEIMKNMLRWRSGPL